MGGTTEPVELLQVLMPQLARMRASVEVLDKVTTSVDAKSAAALTMLHDLCDCCRGISHLDIDDWVFASSTTVKDARADLMWLATAGRALDATLGEQGLRWPEPPGLVADLLEMYSKARVSMRLRGHLAPQSLQAALATVGAGACDLAGTWPVLASASPEQLEHVTSYVGTASALMNRLGVLATIAQALTLPTALLAFGVDAIQLAEYFASISHALGHDVLGLAESIGMQGVLLEIELRTIDLPGLGAPGLGPDIDRTIERDLGNDDFGIEI